ncbi:unnamed protein product [Urochloa humidicola]
MAADCMTRVCALAIATAACVGLPAALVYETVRAVAARRSGAASVLSVFLVVWVAATAAYYPRVCADIIRRSPLMRHLRGRSTFAAVPRELPEYVHGGDADGTRPAASCERHRAGALVSLFAARHQGGMDALRREPPAGFGGGGTRLVSGDTSVAQCERCAVCLCDVEKGEAAAWLPACLHMFHRDCIYQWLHKHGHSTCPICRSDAVAAPPLLVQRTV